MTFLSPIVDLKNVLPEDCWSWTVPALMQDSAVWEALQDSDFRGFAVQKIGSQPKNWSPMNLARLTFRETVSLNDLKSSPLEDLPASLLQKVLRTFDRQTNDLDASMRLEEAGLLAIYLHQDPAPLRKYNWKTALACLYSLVSNVQDFLLELPAALAAHVLLSNPIPPDEQKSQIAALMKAWPQDKKIDFFQEISLQRPALAGQIGSQSVDSSPVLNSYTHLTLDSRLVKLPKLLANVELKTLAGNAQAALPILIEAWQESQNLRNSLILKVIQQKISLGEVSEAMQLWKENYSQFTRDDLEQIAETVLLLVERQERAWLKAFPLELLDPGLTHASPAAALAQAYLHFDSGDETQARQAAQRALQNFMERSAGNPAYLRMLSGLFLESGQPQSAVQAAQLAMRENPGDAQTTALLAESHLAARQYSEAAHAAHLTVALQPENLPARRKLAEILEMGNNSQAALVEWESILALQENPLLEDLKSLIHCALKADQPQRAAELCQEALQLNPEDSELHLLLGKAENALGNSQKAQEYFVQATQLSPESPQPWLALAKIQEPENALETLSTAAAVIPNDWEIPLRIGEIHRQKAALTQALSAFEKAAELAGKTTVPKAASARISSQLGETLLDLGHRSRACQLLGEAYEDYKNNPEITYAYARTLLALKKPEEAVLFFKEAADLAPQDHEIRLDYAAALLMLPGRAGEAKKILLEILQGNGSRKEALALLAETLEAAQEWEAALETYRRAIGTSLREDPVWFSRLSLGLGRAALALNQPDVALAAIKQVLLTNQQDLKVLQTLSAAYLAANLRDQALQTAKSALEVAPHDHENLTWFTQQALQLDATGAAVAALEKAIESDPFQADYLNQLGQVYAQAENFSAAEKCFSQILSLEGASPNELHSAAQGLMDIQAAEGAVQCLNKALKICFDAQGAESLPDKGTLIPKLLFTLSAAQRQLGKPEAALEAINQGIEVLPQDETLLSKKASLLLEMHNIRGAAACIDKAIQLSPSNAVIRLQAARIHRAAGNIPAAFGHGQEAISLLCCEEDQTLTLPTNALLADLADAMLHRDQARAIIEVEKYSDSTNQSDAEDAHHAAYWQDYLAYYCLCAELALDADEEIAAANALTDAMEIDPHHPRVLALQARLTARQGDLKSAEEILLQALEYLGGSRLHPQSADRAWEKDDASISCHSATTLIAVAEAALSFRKWGAAIYLSVKAAEMAPQEPRSHFHLARALVLRAEYQRLCQVLNVRRHAPGESSVAEFTYQNFEEAILEAANLIAQQKPLFEGNGESQPKSWVAVWMARGHAIFRPSQDHAQALGKLPKTPENQTAYLAALRHSGDLSAAGKTALKTLEEISQKPDPDPLLLGQIALALAREEPSAAQRAAQTAVEQSIRHNAPDQPIYHAIQARTAQRNQDADLMLQALQTALKLWGDESRWHEQAANVLLNAPPHPTDFSAVIHHLEQATKLEPKAVSHFLKLGKIHLQIGNLEDATHVLEEATQIAPENAEPWLILAQAYQTLKDIPQCIRCAKQVIQLEPARAEAHLILAEVALEVESPVKAQEFIETVLKTSPNHPRGLLMHAKTQVALNKPEAALASLDRAIQHVPQSVPLQLERIGLIRQTQGEEAALEALEALAVQFPRDAQILSALAEARAENGKTEAAIQAAQDALHKTSDTLELTRYTDLLVLLGRLLRGSGQLDQAIHYLEEASEMVPDAAAPQIELARTYQERRQYDLSLDRLQKAILAEPQNPQPYYLAGQIFKDIKDYANAEAMLRKASELAPENLNIHRQLGAVVAINLVHNPQKSNRFAIPIAQGQ